MFYNQLPDSQQHHLALKPAIDAVELAGRLKGSQYGSGECHLADHHAGRDARELNRAEIQRSKQLVLLSSSPTERIRYVCPDIDLWL